jgi:hypothetical protein
VVNQRTKARTIGVWLAERPNDAAPPRQRGDEAEGSNVESAPSDHAHSPV